MNEYIPIAGLAAIMMLTLVLPFSSKKIEEELEAFLFTMGVASVSISKLWSAHLLKEALSEPLAITATVAALGIIFRKVRPMLKGLMTWAIAKMGLKTAIFVLITLLGLGSGIFTAIIAALILTEIISFLRLERSYEVKLVVYSCFAIGLGAALTPLGEPLSTIAVSKLKGPPHYADFFFLARLLGIWIIPGILAVAFLASRGAVSSETEKPGLREDSIETYWSIIKRAGKVYIFVAALILLGTGLSPIAEKYVRQIPDWALFWMNTLSAILDNATLVAAEILPSMSRQQLLNILIALLISGGMLIPGNIPNIISASKLGIKSREWAREALPLGFALMSIYFVLLIFFVG